MGIGKYILNLTQEMTFEDLTKLYHQMDNMGMKSNRQKAIARIMNLGKYFAKEWFDLDLDISNLPEIFRETLLAGNEEIIDLIQAQIKESEGFVINQNGSLENPNKKSWVNFPVIGYQLKSEKGYVYTTNNAYDLAQRIGRNKRELGPKNLALILETQWKIEYGTFYHPDSKAGTIRGIFIPLYELDGTRLLMEHAEEIEDEMNNIPEEEEEDEQSLIEAKIEQISKNEVDDIEDNPEIEEEDDDAYE